MIRAETVLPRSTVPADFADTITLDEAQRHRRRMAMVSDGGIAFLLDLESEAALLDGDGLVLDDGRVLKVLAKPEPLFEVVGRDVGHCLTLVWHLGQRAVPTRIVEDRIFVRQDETVRELVEALGGEARLLDAPFDAALSVGTG